MRIIKVRDFTAPRLDAYLQKQFPLLTNGSLHKFLRENKIKVNGKKVPLNTQLLAGDEIKLFIMDDLLEVAAKNAPPYMQASKHFTAVYEDEHVLIGDKPAGVLCMDENGTEKDTFINRALRYMAENGTLPKSHFVPCLCHRLDAGTSGLVLIAKTSEAEQLLKTMLQERTITKKYLCVTAGHPLRKQDTLHGWLSKDSQKGIVYIDTAKKPGSKEVVTKYEIKATSGRLALLEVELVTGRTHQIRAHLASIGCPILGDSKYGINTLNRTYKMKYQALCAYTLVFPQHCAEPLSSLSGKTFHAGRPWYVQQVLEKTLQ